MKKINIIFILLTALLCLSQSNAQNSNIKNQYTFKKGDNNGIGKWYMGREIAYVMGYQGINWLERSEREKEENVSRLIENLEIKSNDTISAIVSFDLISKFSISLDTFSSFSLSDLSNQFIP